MIALGYMYKKISNKLDGLTADQVSDIYSVSSCVSDDFADWVNFWKHNGYWFFDTPETIEQIAIEEGISLKDMMLFFYRAYEYQWDDYAQDWINYAPDQSFSLQVKEPESARVWGYDVVSYSCQTAAECSPLSCNHMYQKLKVNTHCLFDNFDEAKRHTESGAFRDCEPGPYRLIEVCSVDAV